MLSLKWFKSAVQNSIEKVVEKKIEQLEKEEGENIPSSIYTSENIGACGTGEYIKVALKPYLNIKMVNDVLTIVLVDGGILTKNNATADDFNTARTATTEQQLFALVASPEIRDERRKEEAEYEKASAIKNGVEYLNKLDDFEMKDGSLYLKGISRSIPPLMVEEFLQIVGRYPFVGTISKDEVSMLLEEDEEYQALKRFFMWCCLNPRAEVADKLYNFLKKNAFKITKQGFFAALRNVVTVHGSNELVHFISNAYNKVKAVWKKKPDEYHVFLDNGEYKMVHEDAMYKKETCTCSYCDGTGTIPKYDEEYDDSEECPECDGSGEYEDMVLAVKGENLGNLTELYLDLPNRAENRFTDAYSRTFDIRIGKAVNMDPDKCRWNTDDCGAEGLHFTSDEIHYVGCGDTSVLVLINPMKVVGIGESKGRCWEYLPIMTVPRDEATSILHDLDFDILELDESYAVRELENLAEKATLGFVTEATKYEFNLPAISTAEIKAIVKNLDEINEQISKRIVKID